MWHADVMLDFAWLDENRGKIVAPRSTTKMRADSPAIDIGIGLYGDDFAIRHMRVVMFTDDAEIARLCVSTYHQNWAARVGLASGFLSHLVAKPVARARNVAEAIWWVCPGGFDEPIVSIPREDLPPKPVNYELAARMMAAWKPDFTHQVFYLAKFFDTDLPLEVRWLNGYRAIEWHFCRGKGALMRNPGYQAFVEHHGSGFDELCRPRQTKTALIEEARALAAHALEYQVEDPRTLGGTTTILNRSYKSLEALVCALLNLGAQDGISFELGSANGENTTRMSD